MKNKIKIIIFLVLSLLIVALIIVSYQFNLISHKQYTNSDFNIETYISKIDKDNEGIDDQTDILNNVKKINGKD